MSPSFSSIVLSLNHGSPSAIEYAGVPSPSRIVSIISFLSIAISRARLIFISEVTLFPIGEPGMIDLSSVTFPVFGTVGRDIPLLSTVFIDSV